MADVTFGDRVVVVTGGGNGLGRCHALLLAARGADVVVNDTGGSIDGSGHDPDVADRVVEEITSSGGQAVASHDSVATADGARRVMETAMEAFGTVDAVVNNAGILRDRSFSKLAEEDLEAVVDVHLIGAVRISQAAFEVMKEQAYGRLVFTSSASGCFGNFGQANYAVAKAGLVGLARVLAIEGAKYGIRANVVAPYALTRMTENLMGPDGDVFDPALVSPLVAYLASEACTVTGEVFSAGAGHYARIFTAVAEGWLAPSGSVPSPEAVRDHLGEITGTERFTIPRSAQEAAAAVVDTLRAATSPSG